jgi:hypothetical protein
MKPEDQTFLDIVLNEIENNAKRASQGRWRIDHGHVIAGEIEKTGDKIVDKRFDVAMVPWESKQVVRGVNPNHWRQSNMRYVATVYPERMRRLVRIVREMKEELEQLRKEKK